MPRIIRPDLAFKQMQRYRQVVAVFTRYGFGEFLGLIRIWEYINIEKKFLHRERQLETLSIPQRLRLALEELGPTFVKLGQMLSTRPDIVPHNFIVELEKLQNRVAPIPTEIARRVIESELKKPISEIFSSFDDQPLAAASLAQVHRASRNGSDLVVKVQRPNITQVIEVDLEIMHNLAALMERYLHGTYVINPVGLVREFAENIKRELDFRIEAVNMRRFAQNFAGTAWVHVPAVYSDPGYTQRVLIMEYVEGIFISDLDRLRREGYDLKRIARHGADIGFRSTLEHGFFHADPHPGNLIIQPGNVICLLDYGMMGTLSNRFRERLGRMIYYIINNDEKRTARALLGLMESSQVIDAETLEVQVSNIIQEYAHLALREIQLGNMLFKLLRLLSEHHVRFPTHLIWLSKAITTVEDVAHKLDPDFDMLEYAKPYARRFIIRNLNPANQTREAFLTALDSFDLLRDLPYDAGVILDQLKKGRVKIEFEHIGLEPIRKTITRVTNRLGGTIVLAAVLVASSLIVVADLPPKVGEVPIIGIAGFGISLILAVVLLIAAIFDR
ncbi:MAG: 2-polyprenylphenol 6-hydroxylase [Chloroflexi bacterium]|nr:2-polyprenylphenol 6-hydroxylase [Chloroflexota bacterium]